VDESGRLTVNVNEPTLEEGEARARGGSREGGSLSLVPDQLEPQEETTMTTRSKLISLLAVLALFAAACGDDENDTATEVDATSTSTSTTAPADEEDHDHEAAEEHDHESEDSMADDEAAPARPERIVSIDPSGTEIIYAIGAGDRVIAVDAYSYFPEGTPVTDLSGWQPNLEAILAFEPDLVVMGSNSDIEAGLEAAGVAVALSNAPMSFDNVYSQIEAIGAATGNIGEAAELVLEMQTEIGELTVNAPDGSGLSYFHELDNTLYSVTSSTFIGAVYALFGLENVADPADADGAAFGYPQLSDEYLVDADPDIIFLADTICCGQSAETVADRAGWDQLSAVQNGTVIELNDDIVSRWGPRLVDFIEAIALAIESATVPA
jgi:iron complex transport system substrate-binding protein